MFSLSETGQAVLEKAITTAKKIFAERFAGAEVAFLAGSIIRGEGTATSDIDLIIVYQHLEPARRETFFYDDFPVECFIHDPETLNYFFGREEPPGYNPMVQMVMEAIEIPAPSEFSGKIKRLAAKYFDAGPPVPSEQDIKLWRYSITNLADDLREPRSKFELTGTGTELYKSLADLYLRTHQKWVAKNKSIPRALAKADPDLQQRFTAAFEELFALGKTGNVIALCEEILAPHGGFLLDGFNIDASLEARKPVKEDV
jgi:predicted nucleotidyltransferase